MRSETLLPNFLGIGAARCGSTWLYRNLARHPDIWLPPYKELHYFDRSSTYPSPSHLAIDKFLDRCVSNSPSATEFRRLMIKGLGASMIRPSDASWYFKFLTGAYGDKWYADLFSGHSDKICGEITPAYSILKLEDIKRIQTLNSNIKIILLLRNPIYRTWSSIRKNRLSQCAKEDILGIIERPAIDLRSNYSAMLKGWMSIIPRDQMFIGFYDDIKIQPRFLLERICEFLGVSAQENHTWRDLNKRVNASPRVEMPFYFKQVLAQKYIKELQLLSDLLDSHATSWYQEASEIINSR